MQPSPFLDLMTQAGPWAVAIVLYLWLRLERKERVESQIWLRAFLDNDAKQKDEMAAAIRSRDNTTASAIRALRLMLYRRGQITADELDQQNGGE